MPEARRSASYFRAVVSVAATVWLVVEARPVLEPLMIAVLLWFLLNAVSDAIARGLHGREARTGPLARWLGGGAVVAGIAGLSVMTTNSVAGFRENLPAYEANLKATLETLGPALGLRGPLDIRPLVEQIQISDLALSVAGSALGATSSLVIVLVYVIFLFVEAKAYPKKLAALAPEPAQRARLADLLARIHNEIEAYIGVKCVIGLAQAVPTFALLSLVGVDGAGFWAVVIFLFSFIPTVGSLIGIVFPSLVAVAQFSDPATILFTIAALAVIQIGGSNWLEPKLMGARLNLSPLVILVAIFAGGVVWGIVGALVAVPLLAVAMIVFAQIGSLRPVAVLLSSDGRLPPAAHGAAQGTAEPARADPLAGGAE